MLAYEVLLTRLFSIVLWHHFAYMIISAAMLGYGASGTALTLLKEKLAPHFGAVYVMAAAALALLMPSAFLLAQQVPFNPLELLWDNTQPAKLLAVYLLMMLPFFCGGFGIGLVFARFGKQAARIYACDILGAGLGSLPGGGAEIFHPEVRDRICEHKADAGRWIDIHRTAHHLKLRTNATMLYGHIENAFHRADHLLRLRELQDETGGFQTFIPLAFHPDNTGLGHLPKASALVDLRTVAVARLMLDNFEHVKAYWIMLGIGTAQTALAYGADDLDGTVRHELIYHDAGATTPEALSVEEIRRVIVEAGREPVERDTLYRRVVRDGATWQTAEPLAAG